MTPTGIRRTARIATLAVVASGGTFAADAAAQDGVATDRAALEALYDATGGADWTDSTNWKTAAPLDTWYGVTTDAAGRVTRLELGENGLTGSLPPALGSLANLERLGLSQNELTGTIPGELGSLANLERLSVGGNELTGTIPDELENLANLELLYLWGNELAGPVPAWLGNLTRLRWVQLGNNELTGPIPDEMRNLVQLELLYLHGNELTGPVPVWLGNLTRLRRLVLSWNALTGPIPVELSNLAQLEWLYLRGNELTGPVPAWLASLTRLQRLYLGASALTGGIPRELGSLSNLERLSLSWAWGLSAGPLPTELRLASLERLDIFVTPACAPAAWQEWLDTIQFYGRLCETATEATIDVAVFHTPAAREESGNIEAVIDLMVAETNQALRASGVPHRIELVERSEVQYTESGDSQVDLRRLANPSDGYLDEVHQLRDRVGADLVHLIVSELEAEFCGRAQIQGAFGVTGRLCGGRTFAHELGHNLGLVHDRYQVLHHESGPYPHPAYGYVNQPGIGPAGSAFRRWRTIMSYPAQCDDNGFSCRQLLRFSNPRQTWRDDPLGVAYGAGGSGLTGPADAAAVLDNTGPVVALWRKGPEEPNRPPVLVGSLPDRTLPAPPGMLAMDVARAFADPEGDALTYAVSSSAPDVVTVGLAGPRVTFTSVGAGTATIGVTATDPGGLSATGSFAVSVAVRGTFTDDPIRPGATPVRAVHFAELRTRIDALRRRTALASFAWTDPVLTMGVTPVRLVHLSELREALADAYVSAGRAAPVWTDAAPVPGTALIRAAHVTELRAAVVALE